MSAIAADLDLAFAAPPTVTVLVDVRLDNRRQLVSELGLEHRATDEDVVTAAYNRWGASLVQHVIGDFAIVVIDDDRRTVTLTRDPMAVRPLYFHHDPGRRLVVASSIALVLEQTGVPNTVDEDQLAAFLHGPYGFRDRSFHRGIAQVAPGTTVVIGPTGAARAGPRWEPQLHESAPRDPREHHEELRHLLLQAARDRLDTDTATALLLSGGIDSGSAALAAGIVADRDDLARPRAYGWGFDELAGDESTTARHLADVAGLDFERIVGDDAYPLADHPARGPGLDSPASWPWDALVTRSYRRIAEDGTGLLMTGGRGDEVIGDALWDLGGLLRSRQFGATASRIRGSRPSGTNWWRHSANLLRRELERWPPPDTPRLGPALRGRVDVGELVALERATTPDLGDVGRRRRYQRIFGYAPLQLTALDSRQITATGMSLVDPWTDRRIVEWVLSLPQFEVTRPDRPKHLLRRTTAPWLPTGFSFVADGSGLLALRNRGLHERRRTVIDSMVADSQLVARGYLEPDYLRQLWAAELAGASGALFEWALAAELWLRRHWPEEGRTS